MSDMLKKIDGALKTAMLAKDKVAVEAMRAIRAGVTTILTDKKEMTENGRRDATDADVLLSIRREIGKCKEPITLIEEKIAEKVAKLGGLVDDARATFEAEIEVMRGKVAQMIEDNKPSLAVFESFLPQQMSDNDIRVEAEKIIAEKGLDKSIKSMGPTIKELQARHSGKFDNSHASQIVKALLT